MAIESTNYQCPSCGGALRFSADTGRLECDYCGSSFTVAQVEAEYSDRLARADAAAARADAAAAGAAAVDGATATVGVAEATAGSVTATDAAAPTDNAAANENPSSSATPMRTYTCSSCAAELVCDQTTAITQCPYCGNQAVAPGVLVDEFKPDLLIPFKLDKKAATSALAAYYKGKKFLPNAFAAANRIEKVQGVYAPFWLFDADVTASATFEATRSRTYRDGDDEVTETDHYDVFRAGEMSFARVPVDGSSKMPDAHMDAIEPFDYSDLAPFSMAYLPGFAADRFDQNQETCHQRAERRMASSMEQMLRDTVDGYDSVTTQSCDATVAWQGAEYCLLPVWMLHTSWRGKGFLFAMNGQTGKLVGDLPVSAVKVIAWFAGVFAVAFAVVTAAIMGLGLLADDEELRIAAQYGIPVLVAGFVCLVFYFQMKTANEAAQANAFMQSETFDLDEESDTFTYTSVTRVKVESSEDKD